MKSVLITGANGFLGRNASIYFKSLGYYIIGVGLGGWGRENHKDYGIDKWYGEPLSLSLLKKISARLDIIIHCAGSGSVGFSIENPLEDFRMTVDTTLYILEYIRVYQKQAYLVYPSSAAVYGSKSDILICEDEKPEPISPYGFHKLIVEKLCESYFKIYNLNMTLIRFFSIYGIGLKKQILWDACKKMILNAPSVRFSGTGEETRDFINVTDAIRLMHCAVQSNAPFQIINGAGGIRTTMKSILEMVSHYLGSKSDIEFDGVIRAGDPRFYNADISRANKLNWKAECALENGIKAYTSWFLENKDG